jgi:XisI protein
MDKTLKQAEKIERYRHSLRQVVMTQANVPRRPDQAMLAPICDDQSGNYLLMRIGWDRRGRAHNILFHLRLIDDQVFIEWDGLERGIANDLIGSGIAKEDIKLATESRTLYSHTEAVAA